MNSLKEYKNWYESIEIDDSFDVKLDFAVKMEKAIAEEGMTKKEFASTIGKSQAWVSKVLRGDANLTIETMCELVNAANNVLHLHIAPKDVNVRWFDAYKKRPASTDICTAWKFIEAIKNGNHIPSAA